MMMAGNRELGIGNRKGMPRESVTMSAPSGREGAGAQRSADSRFPIPGSTIPGPY